MTGQIAVLVFFCQSLGLHVLSKIKSVFHPLSIYSGFILLHGKVSRIQLNNLSYNLSSLSISVISFMSLSADICRVCRSEGTPEKPLYHPCVCTGSIKFIHQEW